MRKVLPVALLVISTTVAWCESSLTAYQRDLAFIQGLYPRLEASDSSQDLLNYITQSLDSLEVSHRVLDFSESEAAYSFSSSLVATLPGTAGTTDTRRPELILAVPLDHEAGRSPAEDGSFGLALAVELIRRVTAAPPEVGVTVVFLGGESSDAAGTRRFLEDFYSDHPAAVIYLNLRSPPEEVVIRTGSNGLIAPKWLVQSVTSACDAHRTPYRISNTELQLFRMGLGGAPTAAAPFLETGLPAVVLESLSGEGTIDPESLLAVLMDVAGPSGLAWAADWDNNLWDAHYLRFRLADLSWYVSERQYVAVVVVLMGLAIMYLRLFRRRVRRDLETATRNFWLAPLLFVTAFAVLMGGTLVVRLIVDIRHNMSLWKATPYLFLALKGTVALFLLTLTNRGVSVVFAVRLADLPSRLFASAALLTLLLDMLVVAIFNIALTVYFLPALVLVFLYGLVKHGSARLGILAASPLSIFAGGLAMFSHPAGQFARAALLSGVRANLVLAAVLLPFLILVLDSSLSLETPDVFARVLRRFAPPVLGVLALVLSVAAFFYPQFSRTFPQSVQVTHLIDRPRGINRIQISSNAPLGVIDYWDGQTLRTIDTHALTHVLPGDDPGSLLQVHASGTPILDRENVVLSLRPQGRPRSMALQLVSDQPFITFDSNYPITREASGTAYAITVGNYPPNPLELELTLPQAQEYTLVIQLEYDQPPFRFEITGANKVVSTRLLFRDDFRFRTAEKTSNPPRIRIDAPPDRG